MASLESFVLIENMLKTSWAETDLVFENEDYELPGVPTEFVYVEIVGDMYEQETFGAPGNNLWLESGSVELHVMTPVGIGSRNARGIGERLSALFRERPLGDIIFGVMSIGAGQPGKDFANYFAITVSIEWGRQDITQP